MSKLIAKEYKRFEDIKHVREDGSEFWSVRELAPALDYNKWGNLAKVIKRAKIACVNEEPFGIAMFAIDLGTVYGLLEKG